MAGAALGFEEGTLQIHQVLAVRPTARGSSGIPLRPDWEPAAHLPQTTPR
jgi:cyclopropane-fatty-acyl-phospholipid synthase